MGCPPCYNSCAYVVAVTVQLWLTTQFSGGQERAQEVVVFSKHRGFELFVWEESSPLTRCRMAAPVKWTRRGIYPPKPYRVLPWRFRAYTTSMAVTVLRRACSVYVTESRMTFSRNTFSTPRVSS